ncbi:MAG: hypothetical protein AB7P03_01815 [Kofleriaceae bacterium]
MAVTVEALAARLRGVRTVRWRDQLPAIAIAAVAIVIAWTYAATVLGTTRPMGLPLDDSYIYLTYAKQFGRGEPFTYFPGGGYSAGSTSALWPMVLAPFWTLGARGHALVWVSYVLCALLYALTCVGVYRIVRRLAGELAGVFAAVVVLGIGPFAWSSLSGMEVAFASALLVATLLLLFEQPRTGPPSKRLIACLAATALSRPEAMLLVFGLVGIAVASRLRRGDVRSSLLWMIPLIPPVAWMLANKLFAGQWMPNTGVAKSHFYLPGFDWDYWVSTVAMLTGKMVKGLFWDATSPLVLPRLISVLWLFGAIRILLWARSERQWALGAGIIVAPLVLVMAVIASSGNWEVQNYRYIAPAFPLLAIGAGCALAPIQLSGANPPRLAAWGQRAVVGALGGWFVIASLHGVRTNALLFAQGAMDTNTQVVAIGRYIERELPDASILFHDAGAIAYYGDGRVYDMLGLITNHQADVTNNGPGSRFEFLEALPEAQRPTHFAYYPSWLGTNELFGEVLLQTPLRRAITSPRFAGAGDMQLIVASWDHIGTGERPLSEHAGWAIVDRVDVASLVSERAHGYVGALGKRAWRTPGAHWSFVHREVGEHGLVLDGGRTIRGGTERFTVALDPAKPARLILRTGGVKAVPFEDTIVQGVELRIMDDTGNTLAETKLPAPRGKLIEVSIDLPAGTSSTLRTEAQGAYRAFHWFALQPE